MTNWRDETMKNVNGLIRIDNDTGVFIDYNTETYKERFNRRRIYKRYVCK